MKMCSKTTLCKITFALLLVALISLIPTNTFKVLADEAIVPPFPYDELQTIGDGNSYALFRVHGIDAVDYVEVISPDAGLHGNYAHLLHGLSYSGLGGWVLQINSIDYCFKNGQKVDFDLQSLFTSSFLPVENDDPYFSCWLEFVYTTEDIYGIDDDDNWATGYGLRFFKAQNFYIEPAATPTPTPLPPFSPSVVMYGDYEPFQLGDIPSYGVDIYANGFEATGEVINIANALPGHLPTYASIFAGIDYDNYHRPYFGIFITDSNSMDNPFVNSGVVMQHNVYGPYTSIDGTVSKYVHYYIRDGGYDWSVYGKSNLDNVNVPTFYWEDSALTKVNSGRYPYLAGYGYCDFYGFNGQSQPNISPTPTPTSAPTPIPQPSVTPEPEDPDENSSWGWGIVNTLKYIFIPDKNKLIRLEKTTQTKFQQFGGGYDDLKRVSGFDDPVRPQNVVMNWQPFGTDSSEQQQQITLVDFEQIDFYLFQTSSGMFICECLKASFTFLMFGYLIHVIRKHFVIENNTSDESDGGGD